MNTIRITRRGMLTGLAASGLAASPLAAATRFDTVDFRGPLDTGALVIAPGEGATESRVFNRMLAEAAARGTPVFLPPGLYELSDIDLPDMIRIEGVVGATRLVYSGNGQFLRANAARRITLANLSIDGANRWLADDQPGLLSFRAVRNLTIDNCEIIGAGKFAISAEQCGGRISANTITGAAESAVYAVESTGLEIRGNTVADCGNGGILVHRWTPGEDGSIVTGNRIARIGARSGGTGQNGNGINIFRANNVQVHDNHVSDCAFTAIRSNAGSNVQILANQCLRSGETAIYSEFGFEGAMIANNLVDGAANGILSVNFNDGGRLATITGNIIRNLKLTGPYVEDGIYFGMGISAEADAVVSSNLIENAPRWGMSLGWGPYLRNLSVTANVIRSTPVGIAVSVVEGAGTVLIRDNLFSEIGEAAIAGHRWAEKVTEDLVDRSDSGFPHLAIGANRLN